ncbi:MAG: NAD-dependent epimerase/dehydratase family protein [Oscillospiraceae bacterium]
MPAAFVLGAMGHIGSYMIPALVDAGYEVTGFSRKSRTPYTAELPQWEKVKLVSAERQEAIKLIARSKPDVVCDLIAYTLEDAKDLVQGLRAVPGNEAVRLISIGTTWIYGDKYEAPVTESQPRNPTDEYGRRKVEIESYLKEEHRCRGLRVTILHPGHICGKGWMPVGPQGNRSVQVIKDIMAGRQILLPDRGQATLHHVHSEDIARLTVCCLNNDVSIGEEFHITSPAALTLFGYAERLYRHFGHEPNIRYVPYGEFLKALSPEDAAVSAEHIDRSPVCSMEKARRMLGFEPKHSSIDTVIESIESIKDRL